MKRRQFLAAGSLAAPQFLGGPNAPYPNLRATAGQLKAKVLLLHEPPPHSFPRVPTEQLTAASLANCRAVGGLLLRGRIRFALDTEPVFHGGPGGGQVGRSIEGRAHEPVSVDEAQPVQDSSAQLGRVVEAKQISGQTDTTTARNGT